MQEMKQLHAIFTRTEAGIKSFRNMIQPLIDHAVDEHTKLYYHHISEEEEQRLERLEDLIPRLQKLHSVDYLEQVSDRELSHLLSDLHLERFGLHNFREHLELALYEFKADTERQQLNEMREHTQQDYLHMKEIMAKLSEKFSDAIPIKGNLHDHDHGHDIHQVDHFHASSTSSASVGNSSSQQNTSATTFPSNEKKGLTVGSLRHLSS
ncbi:IMEF encapsulin system ferritin-like cargo protein [Brevibacillus daliensis]|uniref:IMEF encapsulin system ferritin-like cargo protein n=1 Tax=Brevibacillus daliensis TaxID=2892995 RepID=UPI001E5AAC7D|nr:IMEF encapsulin system ferritin-like cargo protein [Brevibacillus daliensis]